MLRSLLLCSLLGVVAAQDDGFDSIALYIVIAVIVDVLLVVGCYVALCYKGEEAEPEDPVEALKAAFDARNAKRYARALKKAREAGVDNSQIPTVYSLQKVPETFKIPNPPSTSAGPKTISAQLCFILDYTGSMKEQIAQAETSCKSIVESVKALSFPHMPNATVDLEMAAIGYNDWDDRTASLKRPVVMAFGGHQIMDRHDPNFGLEKFNLGGTFTKDVDAMMKWIKQPLGNGGSIPEELTGALLAATHLPWKAEQKIAVVITDAPCHGKEYSDAGHDPFCDPVTGLTCSGKPEVPLLELQRKGVQVVVLHTGQGGAVSMCKKLQQTSPTLVQEKVTPSQTATRLVANLESKLKLPPLTFVLKPLTTEAVGDLVKGVDITIDGEKKTAVSDGLVWMGLPPVNPKVTVYRPQGGYAKWWEEKTEEVEITRAFDEDAYMLKIPPKAVVEDENRMESNNTGVV